MSAGQNPFEALGERIKAIRTNLTPKCTQQALAELCGVDPTYISLLERGERNPPFLTMCLIAAHLKCTLEDLVKGIVIDADTLHDRFQDRQPLKKRGRRSAS